ncbi:endo-beta-1,4-Glucuronan lyase from fungus Trichoderma Reesei [Colletotrichum eremochloae]|nr:endo-beta-1,4-Glucuronan lyase from fungus Trichoderma Reesei [Colletotrichum eremochloae]
MHLTKSLLAAALAVLVPASVHAAFPFSNPGTLSGPDAWDYVRREHNGNVEQVTNVVYKGATALKMTQTYDPAYDNRYHSEVDVNDGYRRGQERFYGFAFRLSDAWQYQPQSYNIAQFIADRPGAGCGDDDWMPSSMLWIEGDQLFSRVVAGQYRRPDCGRTITKYANLTTVSRGEWHRVVIQARWRSDGAGFYKIWFDGEKVLEKYDLSTTVNDDSAFQFRVGLYANGWHDDGQMLGDQAFRQVWFDEIAVGSTFKEVDPAQ